MLRQQHRFFRSVLVAADTCFLAGAVVGAYLLRFGALEPLQPSGVAAPMFRVHALPILAVVPLMLLGLLSAGLYQPRRDQRFFAELKTILKAVAFGMLLVIAFLTIFQKILFGGTDYSRLQYILFAALAAALLIIWRFTFRVALRWIRRRGFNLRHVVIIGTGRLGQIVCQRLRSNSWTGITPGAFISHHETTDRDTCETLPVLGGLADLESILKETDASGIFIALPGKLGARMPELLMRLEKFPLDVRVVPDVNPKYMPMNMAVHELDGMPVLSVRESPLNGWGRVLKRSLDLCGTLCALLVFGLPMLIIALIIRLTSPGPAMFRQRRMSLNGQSFHIFKFRTMTHEPDGERDAADAGKGQSAWTKPGDARITPVGHFLRRWSLDELPQLFNVLRGDMSLVGPRPERTILIDQHRESWRGYMLRQNVKAGITGWAQVNGLRGNTSLRKRLQYDLFYIRNWSILFDLRILWMTIFRGFAHPNAH